MAKEKATAAMAGNGKPYHLNVVVVVTQDADVIEKLNESGDLRQILRRYKVKVVSFLIFISRKKGPGWSLDRVRAGEINNSDSCHHHHLMA